MLRLERCSGEPESFVAALEDLLTTCLSRLLDTFGQDLVPVLSGSRAQPFYGSISAALGILQVLINRRNS